MARENLRLNGVSGTVYCRDVLSLSLNGIGTYDLIFSYGVIEHFADTGAVLRILSSLLAPGGLMVVIVPNMGGIYGPLQRWWSEPVYRMHSVLSPSRLDRGLASCGLESVMTRFFGTF